MVNCTFFSSLPLGESKPVRFRSPSSFLRDCKIFKSDGKKINEVDTEVEYCPFNVSDLSEFVKLLRLPLNLAQVP
jgi:hypothetical protein